MTKKQCSKCGITKTEDQFWKDRRRNDGLRGSCAECEKEAGRLRASEYAKRPDVKTKKAWYEKSKKRKKARQEYRGRPRVKKQRQEYKKQYYSEIPDAYVLELIRRQSCNILKNNEIPDRLIFLKRQSLKLKRLIKQKKDD